MREALHQAAVWVERDGEGFLGSGFLVGGGVAVTAAHVVAADAGEVAVGHPSAADPVPALTVRTVPEQGDGGLFHPYPDLALLTVGDRPGHRVAALAAHDPAPGTEVTALGYSTDTPTPGIQPDTLELRTGGRSGAFVRVLGDGVRQGFSGSMLVGPDGLVVGVLKGSRSYRDVQGGWFTPVSALHALLGAPAAAPPAPRRPTDAELVAALLAFPALARPELRYDLLDRMGAHLCLPYSFETQDRASRRDHLFQLVHSCEHFRDRRAALRALYTAMEEIVPYDRALEQLRELVGRAVGGWEGG